MMIQVPIEHTMNMVMYMESYVTIYLAITDLFLGCTNQIVGGKLFLSIS